MNDAEEDTEKAWEVADKGKMQSKNGKVNIFQEILESVKLAC